MATQKPVAAAGGRRVAKPSAKEQRRMTQTMICGGVFILLVGIKILLPQTMDQMEDTLQSALTHNMDLEEVFSIVGQFGTQENTTQALEQAVFGEEGIAEEIVPVEDAVETTTIYTQENLPENVSLEQVVLGFAYQRPAEGEVSSVFGYRDDPTTAVVQFHYGVDLAGAEGDAIVAFADGTVRAVGESSSYGKYLILDHADGYATLYAHCASIAVSANASVTMGQTIATVGQTGNATGAHLHFELMHDDLYLNPIYYV